MQETTKPNAAHTRVTYQGITYTICRRCSEVIASGKNDAVLLAVEKSHRCLAVMEDSDYERERRLYEERSGK
jgi:hypothetical protein